MANEEPVQVRDRRRVREDGTAPEKETAHAASSPQANEGGQSQPAAELPEINFASFIFSLSHSAFIHLGEEPDPMTGEKTTSLPLAKETIDILSILEEKTRGNRTSDEDQLMTSLLYALRMRYVEKVTRG